MTDSNFRLLDTVALLAAMPDHGLIRGQVGTLVEPLADGVWLVEFSDDHGRTYAMPVVHEESLMPLLFTVAAAA